jgi:ArsR family transcriptional regulator
MKCPNLKRSKGNVSSRGIKMEIPDSIKKQVKKKGGIPGIVRMIPNDEVISEHSTVHKALSEPMRLKILNLLAVQPQCVCMLKEITGMQDSKLSYHLSKLKDAGLIEGRTEGSWIVYHVRQKGKKYRVKK